MGTIFSYLMLWWDAKYQYGVYGADGVIWGLFRGANHTNTNSNDLLQSQKQRLIPWGALGVRWQASGCGGNCVDCVVARDWEDYCLILGTSGSKLDSKCPRGGRYSYLGRCTSNTIMWLDLYNNAAHMGQFLQDGKFGCFASYIFKVEPLCDQIWKDTFDFSIVPG